MTKQGENDCRVIRMFVNNSKPVQVEFSGNLWYQGPDVMGLWSLGRRMSAASWIASRYVRRALFANVKIPNPSTIMHEFICGSIWGPLVITVYIRVCPVQVLISFAGFLPGYVRTCDWGRPSHCPRWPWADGISLCLLLPSSLNVALSTASSVGALVSSSCFSYLVRNGFRVYDLGTNEKG